MAVTEQHRKYRMPTAEAAGQIALAWVKQAPRKRRAGFGLPKVDERHPVWHLPLVSKNTGERPRKREHHPGKGGA